MDINEIIEQEKISEAKKIELVYDNILTQYDFIKKVIIVHEDVHYTVSLDKESKFDKAVIVNKSV